MSAQQAPGTPRWWIGGGLPLAAGLVVVAVAATLLAVRAGGDDVAEDVLVRARAAAEDQGSYRFVVRQGVQGENESVPAASFALNGAVDLESELSRFVITTQGGGLNVRCTQIASADALYTGVHPSRREELGAAWVRSGKNSLLAGTAFQFRPDRLYDESRSAFKGLERSGTEEIRGVRTTRYEGELDFSAFLPRVEASPQPTLFNYDLPVEVFIDDDGLLRRMVVEVRSEAGGGFSFTLNMEMLDYGKDFKIRQPPANTVKEATAEETVTACYPTAAPVPDQS